MPIVNPGDTWLALYFSTLTVNLVKQGLTFHL
jgi:hypothetical protein